VRGIHVQALSEREGDRVIVEGRIRRRIVGLDGCMSQSGNEFLNVSDALSTGNRRAKGGAIPNGILQ